MELGACATALQAQEERERLVTREEAQNAKLRMHSKWTSVVTLFGTTALRFDIMRPKRRNRLNCNGRIGGEGEGKGGWCAVTAATSAGAVWWESCIKATHYKQARHNAEEQYTRRPLLNQSGPWRQAHAVQSA